MFSHREHLPEYKSYHSMVQRCTNKNNPSYKHYGGRGITICDRWLRRFEYFYADMGTRPNGMSLDRINVNGNYEPSNCRWATPKQQANNKRNNRRRMSNTNKIINECAFNNASKKWSIRRITPGKTYFY